MTLMRYSNKNVIPNVFINDFSNLNIKHNKHLRKINQYLSLYNIIKMIVFFFIFIILIFNLYLLFFHSKTN